MITKHFKTDFTILISLLKDDEGIPYPFTIKLYTQGCDYYTASWDGVNTVNLMNTPTSTDDYAVVMLDKHGLKTGIIKQETVWSVDNDDWTNGVIYKAFAGETGYELVATKTDVDGTEMVLPVIYDMNLIKGDKGDSFTFEDFTPEELALINKPSLDAINALGISSISGLEAKFDEYVEVTETEINNLF